MGVCLSICMSLCMVPYLCAIVILTVDGSDVTALVACGVRVAPGGTRVREPVRVSLFTASQSQVVEHSGRTSVLVVRKGENMRSGDEWTGVQNHRKD